MEVMSMSKSSDPDAADIVTATPGTGESTITDVGTARWISAHATELVEHLPHPRCAWQWGECGLSESALSTLRRTGLIEPVEDTERRWQTTRKMWDALPAYTDTPREDIGTLAGQVRAAQPSGTDRGESRSTRQGNESPEQRTLTGESADQTDASEVDEQAALDALREQIHGDAGGRDPAEHPDQKTLDSL